MINSLKLYVFIHSKKESLILGVIYVKNSSKTSKSFNAR